MAKSKKETLTEADVLERISQRSEYAWGYFLTHVGVEGRIADAVWLNPSHLRLIGFEVKTARGDWIKELNDPWKSYAVGKFCDFWYLVVSTPNIVRPGELPEGWGLMVCEGSSTKILQRAPRNEEPERWNRELMTALLRRVHPQHEPTDLERARKDGWADGYRKGLERLEKRRGERPNNTTKELDRLKDEMAKFKEITGVEISAWNMEMVAHDLKILREMTKSNLRRSGVIFAERCEAVASTIRQSLSFIEEEGVEIESPIIDCDGMPGSLRGIARDLIRYDSVIRKAATTIDGLAAIVDAPLPTVDEDLLHQAARVVEPIVPLIGPMLTIGLTRRVALALQEIDHAQTEDEGRGRKVAGQLLEGRRGGGAVS